MSENNSQVILIKKASGEEEPFRVNKLKQSLRNAGAEEEVITDVAEEIRSWIIDGTSTRKIYAKAFALLRKKRKNVASRYKLKNALLEMGPTGYPFEHFVGKIMEIEGYSTAVGQFVEGQCVSHEVDVIATRNKEQILVECKYGNSTGKIINVQVPLYFHSRLNDIVNRQKQDPDYKDFKFSGWIVTNARFSSDAIDYGTCSGLHMLSWDFPSGNGLKDIIDRVKIYPITVLNHLTSKQKQNLMERGVVMCRQLKENPDLLEPFQLKKKEYNFLMEELEALL